MRIGFVKDAFGGMPHVMATDNDGSIEVKSITEYGKSIVNDLKFDPDKISTTIPDGFIFTGFFEKNGVEKSANSEKKFREKSFLYVDSFGRKSPSKSNNISNALIAKFSNSADKINAVVFKAAAFKNSAKRGELLNRINSGKVLFDQRMARVKQNPKFSFSHIEEEIIRDSFGDGFIRKTAQKTKTKRRVARRASVLMKLNENQNAGTENNIMSRMDKARKDVKNGR